MRRVLLAVLATLTVTACAAPTVNQGTVTDGTASGASVVNAASSSAQPAPTWGQRYTWPDGLAIEVAAPKSCKPSKLAQPEGVKRAVVLTVKITNGTGKPVESTLLAFGNNPVFAGKTAERFADSGGPCKADAMPGGTILPGKTFTFTASYAVDEAPGELQIEFSPGIGQDKAVFVGQA